MEINVNDMSHYVDMDVWICDYRQPDRSKKPIRKVPPTKVNVRPSSEAKKKIYYSNYFFKPYAKSGKLASTEIKPYDNTGFRSFTGNPVYIFDNEQECIDKWNELIDEEINYWSKRKNTILAEIDETIDTFSKEKR